ncbi:Transcriptional regulator NRG1 [Madurella mycetomatis]|uniref:C2H2 type master regulator of conidiophore development brlA n=1 Tax=Madurella mycetomatis TaxID=100816 RepID=A0A175W600_9PEZI|nr:Transcriptional regulator NRG1 [Madurella mycetomatis]
MHARDASGRRVSLLNDDDNTVSASYYHPSYHVDGSYAAPSYYPHAPRSVSSTPNTPELLRSDSYDSQMSAEPVSPLTPLYDSGRYAPTVVDPRSQYDEYYADTHVYAGQKRPVALLDSRSSSYEDDAAATSPPSERPGKRFPCRYRESHGCEKTFTTSGHASRHSKIHTAEKAVPCSFKGCTKKFTRADNMKQHLETHYKDKSRTSSSRSSVSSSERRPSTSGKSGRSRAAVVTTSTSTSTSSMAASTPLSPPGGAWDLRGLQLPLTRPTSVRSPSSGLDALAMAVACQEGA